MVNLGNRLSSNRKGRITCRRNCKRTSQLSQCIQTTAEPYKVIQIEKESTDFTPTETHYVSGNTILSDNGGDPVGNFIDGPGSNVLQNGDVIYMSQDKCDESTLCVWTVPAGETAKITLYDVYIEPGARAATGATVGYGNFYDGLALLTDRTIISNLPNFGEGYEFGEDMTHFLQDNTGVEAIDSIPLDFPGGINSDLAREYTGVEAVLFFTDDSYCAVDQNAAPGGGFKMRVEFE